MRKEEGSLIDASKGNTSREFMFVLLKSDVGSS